VRNGKFGACDKDDELSNQQVTVVAGSRVRVCTYGMMRENDIDDLELREQLATAVARRQVVEQHQRVLDDGRLLAPPVEVGDDLAHNDLEVHDVVRETQAIAELLVHQRLGERLVANVDAAELLQKVDDRALKVHELRCLARIGLLLLCTRFRHESVEPPEKKRATQ